MAFDMNEAPDPSELCCGIKGWPLEQDLVSCHDPQFSLGGKRKHLPRFCQRRGEWLLHVHVTSGPQCLHRQARVSARRRDDMHDIRANLAQEDGGICDNACMRRNKGSNCFLARCGIGNPHHRRARNLRDRL